MRFLHGLDWLVCMEILAGAHCCLTGELKQPTQKGDGNLTQRFAHHLRFGMSINVSIDLQSLIQDVVNNCERLLTPLDNLKITLTSLLAHFRDSPGKFRQFGIRLQWIFTSKSNIVFYREALRGQHRILDITLQIMIYLTTRDRSLENISESSPQDSASPVVTIQSPMDSNISQDKLEDEELRDLEDKIDRDLDTETPESARDIWDDTKALQRKKRVMDHESELEVERLEKEVEALKAKLEKLETEKREREIETLGAKVEILQTEKRENEKLKAKLESLQTEKQEKEDWAKQRKLEEKIRRDTEEALDRRMKEVRKSQEEARREIGKAEAEAKKAALERLEAERETEKVRQKQHKEVIRQVRESVEAELEAKNMQKRQEAEAAAAAEAVARAKFEAEMVAQKKQKGIRKYLPSLK
ncbi:hypothetical protein QBC33DRAFT_623432 [Phialemonium atrogriseum]|uniref:Uncharacterized protein n=1 Tax=Phialemonium atrogriseum TaxID=1093897 RepID=A0AAJ0FBN0_9PEZI|nr:uncharacterized protein QBC33DRAFT_623432 [Phialemonium atrogriseum]KAK1762671.1 hypothetical protein QBC33DRAFT_623432 [Phialemonium atrogriseum]